MKKQTPTQDETTSAGEGAQAGGVPADTGDADANTKALNEALAKQIATVDVRALVDLPPYGAKSGELATIPVSELAGLKADGYVDDDPGAVAYARSLREPATQ